MRALTVRPGEKESLVLRDVPEPAPEEGSVLVDGLAVGLCGTDQEIAEAQYGQAPPGAEYLVLGHENLGRVREAPDGAGVAVGDLVVGIVRRPDPVPCGACAIGEWDMCHNGRYTEHGITRRHGFARERWRVEPDALVRLDPALAEVGVLLEPTTILAKAWEQVERIGARAFFAPTVVAVTGRARSGCSAPCSGYSAASRCTCSTSSPGLKPKLVHALGVTYHTQPLPQSGLLPDITIECKGGTERGRRRDQHRGQRRHHLPHRRLPGWA
jgi:threonine dehydrogenase-like Zn-dependent dehydrogenase